MNDPNSASGPRENPRLVLLTVCLGLFMAALNQRALLVSLPTLTQVFHASLSLIQWTLLAYDLTIIGLVLTLGGLGDSFGRKRIYVSGFVLFISASVLCGLSQSPAHLIGSRVLQGVGGAMLLANGRAIVSLTFPAEERGKALGLTSTAFHVGFLTGPTLGGFVIDAIGWRWIFYLNIPVGLAGAYLAWKVLAEPAPKKKYIKVDFLGGGLLLLANTSFIYAMNRFPHLGFRHPAVASLLVTASIALGFFIRTELRAETPILSLSLFRSRLFTAANLSLFFITSTQSAISFMMPFYLQSLMGFTPTQMGWIVITNSVVIILIAPVAGWLSDRLGSRLLCSIGSSLIVLGQFFIASLTLESSVFSMIFPLALTGLGWAIFNSPNQSAILGAVPAEKVGAASGMTVTTARVGAATGIALCGAIFTYGLSAAGLSQTQIESPKSWSSAPDIFLGSFGHTVHIVNFFTLLSVFFSAIRGSKKE